MAAPGVTGKSAGFAAAGKPTPNHVNMPSPVTQLQALLTPHSSLINHHLLRINSVASLFTPHASRPTPDARRPTPYASLRARHGRHGSAGCDGKVGGLCRRRQADASQAAAVGRRRVARGAARQVRHVIEARAAFERPRVVGLHAQYGRHLAAARDHVAAWRQREVGRLHDQPVLFKPPVFRVEPPASARHAAGRLELLERAEPHAARARIDAPDAPVGGRGSGGLLRVSGGRIDGSRDELDAWQPLESARCSGRHLTHHPTRRGDGGQ
eukprot:CAMPEP_0119399366 /NCGR_PEP_ID=MMETSP1334-20130426/141324_1 /TAXON_ID=127549 /ORGANISM="Calcidiscus leptoporus, Strain RCC1130" /LENGTH=268 /DNA_ID=CAMNT_0007423257 /DNA_START=278 /DNA_END=1084 /DNA_ORIENTATION=-